MNCLLMILVDVANGSRSLMIVDFRGVPLVDVYRFRLRFFGLLLCDIQGHGVYGYNMI